MKQLIKQLGKELDTAAKDSKIVAQLSNKHSISLSDAYSIQKESIDRRFARGEKLSGVKLGFTSKAKMKQMGVHDLIWGRLTDVMEIKNGGEMNLNNFIHPRVEPEIVFLVKEDVNELVNKENAFNYIESVASAIEIIDSRYKNFKFSLEDVIADNCSSAGYIIGDWHPFKTGVSNLALTLSINDKEIESGNTNAILGNPLESFIEACRITKQYNLHLKKGMIVLAGAATPATFVTKGDRVEASFEVLGKVSFLVK